MKKVLLLGGAPSQIPSIKKTKELGYYAITCDYLPDNPGHKFADEYYNVSTTDKEAVLELAKKLKIDGIVCYASDPAAPTAAYVAEKMGLPGHPYKSVEILSNKDLFRKFLFENGFNTPRAKGFTSLDNAKKDWDNFTKPVMVKPVDSSGSKGITKIYELSELENAFNYALSFSRAKRIVLEEYIEADGCQITGDCLSYKGKFVFGAFANQHYDKLVKNPFTPVGASWPYLKPKEVHQRIFDEIQKVFTILNMHSGAYNVEVRIDKDQNIYLMEVGPRSGGNMMPQVIQYATGVDMVEYVIKSAVGEEPDNITQVEPNKFWAYYALHSTKDGIFNGLSFDKDFEKNNLIELNLSMSKGDKVTSMTGSSSALGIMILKFETKEEMLEKMDNMEKYVKTILI